MFETAQWLGLDYLQLWGQMVQLRKEGKAGYYCFYLPDPDRGGEAELTKYVRQIREAGGHVGFYVNNYTFDAELPAPVERWKEETSPGILVPDWQNEYRKYVSVFSDGHAIEGTFMNAAEPEDKYAGMCPGADGWREYFRMWIVDKYVKEYGVDAFYMDSLPVGMLGASRICFSRDHGDGSPHGTGTACIGMVKLLRESAKARVDLALATEFPSDAIMQYQTHALGSEFAGFADLPHPEIYTYTFPKHLIFSGSCNGWSWVTRYYDDLPNPSRIDTMNRVFLLGLRFDAIAHPLDRNNDYAKHLKRLIDLRKIIKGELYNSSFRDTVGLGDLPEDVEARVFRGDAGNSATITILDHRVEKTAFPMELDRQALNIGDIQAATLFVLGGGSVPLEIGKARDPLIEIAVPALGNSPSAVVAGR